MTTPTADPHPVVRVTPYQPPDLTAIGRTWRPDYVAFHGPHHTFVWPGRRVLDGTWPAPTPEHCPATGTWVWIHDRVLVCANCGLDGT